MIKFNDYKWAMSVAFDEANKAYDADEVPVGACLMDNNGHIVATGHNTKEREHNPCGHAEINVIRALATELESWRLTDYHLVVTLEPCLMCASALLSARISSLAFGAYDLKGGFISLGYNFHLDQRLNHRFNIIGGIGQFDSSRLMSDFFRQKRRGYR